jgi:uncharacterized membrane protein YbaN (DUF454 family)
MSKRETFLGLLLLLVLGVVLALSPATPALLNTQHVLVGVPRWLAWLLAASAYGGSGIIRAWAPRVMLRALAFWVALFPGRQDVSWPWIAARVAVVSVLVVLLDAHERHSLSPPNGPSPTPGMWLRLRVLAKCWFLSRGARASPGEARMGTIASAVEQGAEADGLAWRGRLGRSLAPVLDALFEDTCGR